jgi:hypothetical protein
MTRNRGPSEQGDAMAPARTAPETQVLPDAVEAVIAPAAIERALAVYQQMQPAINR